MPQYGELVVTHVAVCRQGYHVEASILVSRVLDWYQISPTKLESPCLAVKSYVTNFVPDLRKRILPPLDEMSLLLK